MCTSIKAAETFGDQCWGVCAELSSVRSFASFLLDEQSIAPLGSAIGRSSSRLQTGVPAKNASAIRMPKEFLELMALDLPECVGSIFMSVSFFPSLDDLLPRLF